MSIRLQEAARYLFYAPFYAALSLRLYEEEGLEVTFVPAGGSSYAANAVLDGAVDVAWGGPSRMLADYDKRRASDLVAFCEVVTRDPFFLVGATARPALALKDLAGLRVGIVREVPTPWLCLQEDLRRAGVDPRALDVSAQGAMPENLAALWRGELDAVQLFEPFVSQAVEEGGAHIWYAGASRGPTSYTTLYARREYVPGHRPELKKMVRAIYRVQGWMASAPVDVIADAVRPFFPETPIHVVAAGVRRHRDAGIWGRDPRLPRSGFDRLKASFLSGGFIAAGLPFELAVDNSLAHEVIAQGVRPIGL